LSQADTETVSGADWDRRAGENPGNGRSFGKRL